MAEPNPLEDQSTAKGFQSSMTGAELMARLLSTVTLDVAAADKTALDAITDQAANALGLTLDTATLYLWDDTGESWVEIGPLRGPAGADGADGTDGAPGAAGADGTDGEDGPAIELQVSATHVQWRVVGAETWTDLIALSAITGPAGADGEDGAPGADGADGATTLAALTDVDVTTAAPTDGQALVWDETSETWIPGDAGGSGTIGGSTGATDNAILRADGTEGGTIQAGTNAPTYSDTGVLTVAPAAVTGSDALSSLEINQTWNTTGNPSALKVNVTNTASGASAKLIDLQMGGASKAQISSSGKVLASSNGSFVAPDISFIGYEGTGLTRAVNSLALCANSAVALVVRSGGEAVVPSTGSFAFSGASNYGSADDTFIRRDSAGVIAQRNDVNAQEFRLYGSYSSATAYQRLSTKTLRQAITAASGATLVSTITIPQFTHLIGVTTRVTTALGTSNGTTGYQVGDGTDPDLWGAITGTAAGTTSDAANFTDVAALGPSASDRTITLTAVGGNFDGVGVIEVCAFYLRAEAD